MREGRENFSQLANREDGQEATSYPYGSGIEVELERLRERKKKNTIYRHVGKGKKGREESTKMTAAPKAETWAPRGSWAPERGP